MEFGQNVLSLHLFGVVLGAMGAFSMGLVLSKLCANGDLTRKIYQGFRYSLKASNIGIAVAWSSMIVYISYLGNIMPETLVDPLLWARVSVLVLITINLYYLRNVIMPMAKRRVGVSIFGGLSAQQQNNMITLGAVSSVIWITSLVFCVLDRVPVAGENTWLIYAGFVSVVAVSLGLCLVGGKVAGHWARKRFMNKMRARQEYYKQLVNNGPHGNYL